MSNEAIHGALTYLLERGALMSWKHSESATSQPGDHHRWTVRVPGGGAHMLTRGEVMALLMGYSAGTGHSFAEQS